MSVAPSRIDLDHPSWRVLVVEASEAEASAVERARTLEGAVVRQGDRSPLPAGPVVLLGSSWLWWAEFARERLRDRDVVFVVDVADLEALDASPDVRSRISDIRFTRRAWLVHEERSIAKNEFEDGRIIAMAGASLAHNLLVNALSRIPSTHLLGTPCRAVTSDQRIEARRRSRYRYPDLVAWCGKPEFSSDDPMMLTNPVLWVEVQSESTRETDLTEKVDEAKQIPTLATYAVFDPIGRTVRVFERSRDWGPVDLNADDQLLVPALGWQLTLADLFSEADPNR